ncbi:TraC family protein [Sinorhizobium meliloti]|uniref:TraC n=1 Tax=Sinorhizobium meliloti (strain SM11) TaxID=707241 RepID=A4KVP7_SINMM|nr:TraC family protein [Sinorhizobium meliloti]ABN47148.1 TraC [Sinorhizobium meliloti SM11]ARS66244.1 conjugal transfer protein TraC [Sinorhizobium meliloti RU11/001]MDE3765439.1 TraC family protein [Sinorhizobium meliloti]MDE3779201.1 TraC family protein [Sinorhizobium meliloti]MDE3804842.1 TraC family protein [Sinorhizobium meliloti]
MKKPTAKLREELARLQEELKQAETRDAERIGRIALKAGLGDFEVDTGELQSAFEEIAKRFRNGSTGGAKAQKAAVGPGQTAGQSAEA